MLIEIFDINNSFDLCPLIWRDCEIPTLTSNLVTLKVKPDAPKIPKGILIAKGKTPKFVQTTDELIGLYELPREEVIKIVECVQTIMLKHHLFGFTKVISFQQFKGRKLYMDSPYRQVALLAANSSLYRATHELLQFVKLNGEGSWAKILKWKFASYFSYWLNEDLPPVPDFQYPKGWRNKASWLKDPSILLPGNAHEFIMEIRRSNWSRFLQILTTVLQLKKGMPEVPKSMIENSINSTVKTLTTEQPPIVIEVFDDRLADGSVVIDQDVIQKELIRTVDEIFCKEKFTMDMFYEPFFPSTSANYVNSRGECGALNILYEQFEFGKLGSQIDFGSVYLDVMEEQSPFYGNLGVEHNLKLKKIYDAGLEQPESKIGLVADVSRLKETWMKIYFEIFQAAKTEQPFVKAVGLAEPLKVRVITKGPPLLYTCLKPIQKWIWSTLKKHKVFALIGRYVTENDIERINKEMTYGFGDYISLSGDYQEATNLIRSFASETVCRRIMFWIGQNMDEVMFKSLPQNFLIDMLELFERSLTHHIFETLGEDDGLIFLKQLSGQLMGSITSFVILCIVNAAVCRYALELANQTKYRITDHKTKFSEGNIAPLGVNGDDCNLCGHGKYLRRYWEGATSVVGLKTSLGKTYFGDKAGRKKRERDGTLVLDKIPKFCTINSTIFVLSEPSFDGENYIKPKWSEVKYVNLGLLYGKSRSSTGNGKKNLGTETLGNISRELKRSCPPNLWLTVKQLFIKMNKAALTKYKLSWFRPEWCGGLGLPIDNDSEISKLDLQIAAFVKKHMNHEPQFKPTLPKEMVQWKMHQLVMKDIKKLTNYKIDETTHKRVAHCGKSTTVKEQFSSLYKYMTIDLLMKTPLEQLYDVVDDDKSVHAALMRNARIDAKIIPKLMTAEGRFLYPPMEIGDLLYEAKDFNLPCFVQDFQCYDHLKDEYLPFSKPPTNREQTTFKSSLIQPIYMPEGFALESISPDGRTAYFTLNGSKIEEPHEPTAAELVKMSPEEFNLYFSSLPDDETDTFGSLYD